MHKKLWHSIIQPAVFMFDAETAHGLALKALKAGIMPCPRSHSDPRLHQNIAELTFDNPIGAAAGFDKNAEIIDPVLKLGFGFSEVGTITPKAQSGNPKPRIFRLAKDKGVINRLGFNNEGHSAALARLKRRHLKTGIIGINVGANKDSDNRINDYILGIEAFYNYASYFTINISSPNTPGLRDLQARDQLALLLAQIMEMRAIMADKMGKKVPVFLKIAPDVYEAELDDIVAEVCVQKLEGIIVSNTTLDRSQLSSGIQEDGGLSGKPLFQRSTKLLAKTRQRAGKDIAIIGVGGVDDAQSACTKIQAGADLVQLYSGMIYKGPGIANEINRGLSRILDERNVKNISLLRDETVADWAKQPL